MLKLKENANIEELVGLGFTSFKVNRDQTNYYFAVRRGNHVIIVNNKTRTLTLDNIHDSDSRLHANIKWQNKTATVEDGVYLLANAGLIERV